MNRLKTYLSLPSEGLSLFRRGIGLLCLIDAIWRLPTVTFFLSDLGVLPRSQYFRFFQDSYAWSLYLVSGRPEVSAFLLLVTAGLGALHLAGKSRLWSRICLWVLVFSVQNRHPGVLDASDDLLRLMIFWDIFLPEESKDQKDWLTPATVGWQVQLLFVCIFTATSLSGSHLALAAQWGGGASAADLLSLPVIAQVSLALLALSIVVAPIRLLAVLSMFAACLFWAYLLHPLAPLTLAVASLSLLKNPKREMESALWPSRKWIWGLVFFVSTLSLALNLLENGSQRRPFVSVAQATGFLQDWSRVYPLQAESLVELVARAPTDETVIWTVTSESGRRERLLAQRLLQSPEWGAYLSRALAFESGNPASLPSVWMRVEDLRADYGLSGSELRLVSTTPVQVDTRRKLNP